MSAVNEVNIEIIEDHNPTVDNPEIDVLAKRIDDYICNNHFPSKIQKAKLKDLKRTTSILNDCGVRLIDADQCEWFVCLLDGCHNTTPSVAIKCTKTGSSNATHHLERKHGITSKKTQAANRRMRKIEKHLASMEPSFKEDPERWFQVSLSAWCVEQSIPFRAFETDLWRLISRKLPVGPGAMKTLDVRKHITELYESVKAIMVSSLKEARAFFSIPFLSLNLDLIKSVTSNEKFLALRVGFNTSAKQNIGFNLAVRRFAPTLNERTNHRMSDILQEWSSGVLAEFGIDSENDVLTSTSDSGSDVKRALVVVLESWWEWCVSHLIHLALSDAFGTTRNPSKSKNPVTREFFQKIKRVIESVNKSEHLQTAFQEVMIEHFGRYIKLLNSPQHRWSATALVLERILICWDALKQAHRKIQRPVPLNDCDRIQCIEFYSLIKPVRQIQVKAQSMQCFVAIEVFIGLYGLYTTVLDVTKPLTLLEPRFSVVGGEIPVTQERLHCELDPATQLARELLFEAMSTRYFNRYHPVLALRRPQEVYSNSCGRSVLLKSELDDTDFRFQYVLDAQSLLYPAMASGELIRLLINNTPIDKSDVPLGWTCTALREQHFKFVIAFIWKKITYLAETVADVALSKSNNAQTENSLAPAARSEQPSKRAKTGNSEWAINLLSEAFNLTQTSSRPEQARARSKKSAQQMVEDEISILKEVGNERNRKTWPTLENTCSWWAAEQLNRLPFLGQAALAILANKPSSGGLECDLGTMKDVLAPKRSSMRSGLVEMSMFLKINKTLIPRNPDEIVRLDKTWTDKIPKRPFMPLYDADVDESEPSWSSDDDLIEVGP